MHTIKKIKFDSTARLNATTRTTLSDGVLLEVGFNNEKGELYHDPIYPSRDIKPIHAEDLNLYEKLLILRLKNILDINEFKSNYAQREKLLIEISLLLEKIPNLTLDFTYDPEAYKLLLWIQKVLLEDRKKIKVVADIKDIQRCNITPDFVHACHRNYNSIIDFTQQGQNVLIDWGVDYNYPNHDLMTFTIRYSDDNYLYAVSKEPRKVRQICRGINLHSTML